MGTGIKRGRFFFSFFSYLWQTLEKCMYVHSHKVNLYSTYLFIILCSYSQILTALCNDISGYARVVSGRGQFLFSLPAIWIEPNVSFEAGKCSINIANV